MQSPAVVILSTDTDFVNTLQEQLQQTLSLACAAADTLEQAQAIMHSQAVLVTYAKMPADYPFTVIVPEAKPIMLQRLLQLVQVASDKVSKDMLLFPKGYVLQPRQKLLAHSAVQEPIALTDKETQLLMCLYEAKGESVSKEQLLKDVWGIDVPLETHTLETHIYRLRAKLREWMGDDTLIAAQDGGYALAGEA